MQYFIIEKICENACKLILMGNLFDCIGDYVRRLNRDRDNALYIITEGQMQHIFFSGCDRKCIDEYWKKHAYKDTRTESPFLYMPLPSNYKEYISDFKWFDDECK